MEPTPRDVATPLGRIRVSVAGDGPAILFWPSLLMTGELWSAQVARFAATHTTIAVDPPGHGASEPLTGPFTFDDCVEVITAILDDLAVDQAVLVGNSWGAMVSARCAATRPERVRAAVLLNGTASPAGLRQRIEYPLLVRAAALLGGIRGPLTRPALDAFLGPTTRRARPEVVARVRKAVHAADPASVGHAVTSVVPQRPDQRRLLQAVTCPVLVVAGDEDATFPVAECAELAGAIPHAEFVVLPGVAHLAAVEVPDVVSELIGGFLVRAG
ncbi:alpha/beta fold hydrolase [Pseudonocardia sp. CA-107938]|uniref:alpha/beta fold hydrolase n=1 Tax=Pseudonocardia sp. CA-107938 TaxID=3240021 RepID=UPI003D948085